MKTMHTREQSTEVASDPDSWARDEVVVSDRVSDRSGLARAARMLALVVGAGVTLLGLVAALRVDWEAAEYDAPLVSVADYTFTPTTAVVTAGLGLLLIGAAAAYFSPARITMGAIVATVGVAILLADDLATGWNVSDRHGWLALLVGVVFIGAGLLSEHTDIEHRRAVTRTSADAGQSRL